MIAEGRAIRHGAANIDYAMGKEMAEVVKINSLSDNIEPLAMWSRMMQLQHYFGKDSLHIPEHTRSEIRRRSQRLREA